MSSNSDLNSLGQVCLAGSVTVSVNLIVHPICTVKNRLMANETALPVLASGESRWGRVRCLYGGLAALCGAESAYNAATYLLNDRIERATNSSLVGSTTAGLLASPLSAVGEAVMVNRQVNQLALLPSLRRALRISGMAATALRDVPFTVAVLGGGPRLERALPISNDVGRQIVGGALAGAIAGAITTPVDTIKTLVQASDQSLFGATRQYLNGISSWSGLCRLFQASSVRASYVGLSVALMNVFNNQFAQQFPEELQR